MDGIDIDVNRQAKNFKSFLFFYVGDTPAFAMLENQKISKNQYQHISYVVRV